MSKFSEHWESREYEDIKSCSRVDANKTLQEVVTRRFREALTRRMQRQIGRVDNVFDIGCGTGEWIRGYLSFCERATGIDANLAFREEARRRLSDVEHRVELWHGDALDYEYFEDVGFAYFGASLMYFGDSECRSILEKMAEAQNEGDWIYIRATVADPWG